MSVTCMVLPAAESIIVIFQEDKEKPEVTTHETYEAACFAATERMKAYTTEVSA